MCTYIRGLLYRGLAGKQRKEVGVKSNEEKKEIPTYIGHSLKILVRSL